MLKFLCFTFILTISIPLYAQDESVINFLTEKTLTDFQKGVELYNQEREKDLPEIKAKDDFYTFKIKKNQVRFTIVGYLKGQIFVNEKLSSLPFSQVKTSWLNIFIAEALADDLPTLDGDSTRVLLKTLSTFAGKLEKVGMTCFSDSCKREIREKNLSRISATLRAKKEECEERKEETGSSLNRFKQLNSIHALAMTVLPEYENIKKFMQQTLDAKKKDVNSFMEDYMGSDAKPHANCMEIMLAGSLVDGKASLSKLSAAMALSTQAEAIVNKAKSNCIELQELKSCMVGLRQDAEAISNAQRQPKDRVDIPNVQEDSYRRTMSK